MPHPVSVCNYCIELNSQKAYFVYNNQGKLFQTQCNAENACINGKCKYFFLMKARDACVAVIKTFGVSNFDTRWNLLTVDMYSRAKLHC